MQTQTATDFVLGHFNFARVHAVMTHLGWTWHFEGSPRVPMIDELRAQARLMVLDVLSKGMMQRGYHSSRGGGLAVSFDGKTVRLMFQLEHAYYVEK